MKVGSISWNAWMFISVHGKKHTMMRASFTAHAHKSWSRRSVAFVCKTASVITPLRLYVILVDIEKRLNNWWNMDKIMFLMELFVLILIVEFTHGDSPCDCSSLMDEQTFIRSKLHQIELDNFKIKSRLRRLETTQRHSTRPNDQKTSEGNYNITDHTLCIF